MVVKDKVDRFSSHITIYNNGGPNLKLQAINTIVTSLRASVCITSASADPDLVRAASSNPASCERHCSLYKIKPEVCTKTSCQGFEGGEMASRTGQVSNLGWSASLDWDLQCHVHTRPGHSFVPSFPSWCRQGDYLERRTQNSCNISIFGTVAIANAS